MNRGRQLRPCGAAVINICYAAAADQKSDITDSFNYINLINVIWGD